MIFEIALATIQLCHLLIFAEANSGDFVVWSIVHGVAQLSLALLRYSARHCTEYVFIPWRILATLILIAFVFKMSSRMPYIQSWLSEGLLATRHNTELGKGGWYTYGSMFFYPLSILLAFCTMPRSVYRILLLGVLAICSIDFIAMGTRNAPMFVMMFYLLSMNFQFQIKRALSMSVVLAIIFTTIFNYSTVNRSYASGEGNFDWQEFLKFTNSTEVLKIDSEIVALFSKSTPNLSPTIFLSHYLAHPISELNYFIDLSDRLPLGGMYGVRDQICVVGTCDRAESQWEIESTNPRAGVYQTIWVSLILDFGWGGAIFIFALTVAMLYGIQRIQRYQLGISLVIFTQLIMLSPIENYLYNGLGLIHLILTFVSFLAMRFLWLVSQVVVKPALHNKSTSHSEKVRNGK